MENDEVKVSEEVSQDTVQNEFENVSNVDEKSLEEKAKEMFNDVKDTTNEYSKEDIENNKIMSIVCYLSFLVLIPFFFEKKSKWVKFHAKQGMNLFVYEVIVLLLSKILFFIGDVIGVISSLVFFILSLVGIINVCNSRAKELPILNKISLIK